MLYPRDNYEFSVPVMSRNFVPVLIKGVAIAFTLRLAARHHRDALWVGLSTPTNFVVPLDKELTIASEARLGNCSCIALLLSIHGHIVVNVDKLTELAIITWIEHTS